LDQKQFDTWGSSTARIIVRAGFEVQTQMRSLHPIESVLGVHSFTVISYLLADKEESAQLESLKR
jgi:hypothetical protein